MLWEIPVEQRELGRGLVWSDSDPTGPEPQSLSRQEDDVLVRLQTCP